MRAAMNQVDGGVEVLESGRALKVQSEVPHLVSLGGGRLSTAVTLHPLPEGRITIGSEPTADIVVQGTGVEAVHCHIDNIHGLVTLHPVAEMTAVDGLPVVGHTRLSQGSMVCIGRSNYMRFNHPVEARIMKSILPNTRISSVPLNFYTDSSENDGLDRKPPIAPRRSPRDSWGDISNSSSCNSGSEDFYSNMGFKVSYTDESVRSNQARTLSPKVFPKGSATVNSPACAVLGSYYPYNQVQLKNVYSSSSPSNGAAYQTSEFSKSTVYSKSGSPSPTALKTNQGIFRNNVPDRNSAFSTPVIQKSRSDSPSFSVSSNSSMIMNGCNIRSQTPTSVGSPVFFNKPTGISNEVLRNVTPSPSPGDNQTLAERRLGSMSSLPSINSSSRGSPSPSFKASRVLDSQISSPAFNCNPTFANRNLYSKRSITPTPPKASAFVVHQRHASLGSAEYVEPSRLQGSPTPSFGSNCSLEELAARKEELEQKRNQAQADRLREQETERLERARLDEILNMCADYERQVQLERQNKSPTIPQNRIKTNGSLPREKRLASPGVVTSEDELMDIFTFDQSSLTISNSTTPAPASVSSGLGRSPYENVMISGGTVTHPQSPRTRIRTIVNKEPSHNRDNSEVIENRLAILNDYEHVTSLPRRLSNKTSKSQDSLHFPSSPNTQPFVNNDVQTPTSRVTHHSYSASTPVNGNQKPTDRGKLILPLDSVNALDLLSKTLEAAKDQNMQTWPKDCRGSSEQYSSYTKPNSGNEQNMTVSRGFDVENNKETEQWRSEYEALRRERSKLQTSMSNVKQNITDIEQQEEEMLRGLEMERALLDGEWAAQHDKLGQDQERQSLLRAQLANLDKEVTQFSTREAQRQVECKVRLEAAEQRVKRIENEISECGDDTEKLKMLNEELKKQKDLLDQEKKLFEDLEFRHLEEEANCLAGHEEIQRELSELSSRVDLRQRRLQELEEQKLEAQHSAEKESQGLQRQLLTHLRSLEEMRNQSRKIEAKLQDFTNKGLVMRCDSSPEASSDTDEPVTSCTQLPEDLARISNVTTKAPLEFGTGSLGRRTVESLQAIERNRQLHLAQQGGTVIENERKRVAELKRRAQNEVRAQWAEQKQSGKKSSSLNSIGDDDISSDLATESMSSEDAIDKCKRDVCTDGDRLHDQHALDSTVQQQDSMREKELAMEQNREEKRPLTDGSDYEQHLPVHLRDRHKSSRLQHQRPLTRYLPIRSERLDLRQHIETAGHQVELCKHVTLDTTSCRGFLQKLGSTFHHWAKRWFVFDRNQRTFTYYADSSEKKARGGAYFQAIEEVYVDHLNSVKSPSPHLTFVVKTSDRMYYLMAPSPEAMRIWVDVVFTGAEGYQAFEDGS